MHWIDPNQNKIHPTSVCVISNSSFLRHVFSSYGEKTGYTTRRADATSPQSVNFIHVLQRTRNNLLSKNWPCIFGDRLTALWMVNFGCS